MMNAEARTESRPLNADRIERGRVRAAAALSVRQLNLLRWATSMWGGHAVCRTARADEPHAR